MNSIISDFAKIFLLSAQTKLINAIHCGFFTDEEKDKLFDIFQEIFDFMKLCFNDRTTTGTPEVK